jgi:hypothetical protein
MLRIVRLVLAMLAEVVQGLLYLRIPLSVAWT